MLVAMAPTAAVLCDSATFAAVSQPFWTRAAAGSNLILKTRSHNRKVLPAGSILAPSSLVGAFAGVCASFLQRHRQRGRSIAAVPPRDIMDDSGSPSSRRGFFLRLILRGISSFGLFILFLVLGGTLAFKAGLVNESIRVFDAAGTLGFPRSMLWQRGISLYYVGRFEEGAMQFRNDIDINPNDTEEAIWTALCEARGGANGGLEAARAKGFVVPAVGEDPRSTMREVYTLFKGGSGADVAKLALEQLAGQIRRTEASENDAADGFYAALYLGLFAEACGDAQAAKGWIQLALTSAYADGSIDYMVDVARVHAHLRGWDNP